MPLLSHSSLQIEIYCQTDQYPQKGTFHLLLHCPDGKESLRIFPNFPIPSEAKAVDVGTFEVYREVPLCQLNQGAFFTSLIIPFSEVQQTRSLCRQIWSQFVCRKTLQKMCFLSIQGYIFQVVHVVVDDRLKTRRAEEEQWWEKKRIKRQNDKKINGKVQGYINTRYKIHR